MNKILPTEILQLNSRTWRLQRSDVTPTVTFPKAWMTSPEVRLSNLRSGILSPRFSTKCLTVSP
ncbi:hypothetical protein BGZ89_006345, partial [Linnemannia elongata]